MGFKNISGMAAVKIKETKVPVIDLLRKVNPVGCATKDMDAVSLNYRLTKFIMEVAKDSGERYQTGIVCGLKRHLGDKNSDKNKGKVTYLRESA